MKERISSFIIACALVFSCVAIPFLTRPVPASATGVEGMLSWEYMMHLWALEGLFTHDSANYYGGFQGYTDEQKSNAMSGLKDFYDGQTRDLKNWLVVGKGIAEAKVNDWWDKLKSGTLDLVGDVGSAVYDWLNAKSSDVSKQWETPQSDIDWSKQYTDGGKMPFSAFQSYCMSLAPGSTFNNPAWSQPCYGFMISSITDSEIRVRCFSSWNDTWHYPDHSANYRIGKNSDGTYVGENWYLFSYSRIDSKDPIVYNPYGATTWKPIIYDGEEAKIKQPVTYEDLENQKQLPAVIDTYGGNLPKPYRDPNNDDDGDGKEKPVPYVPQPIHIDWPKIHGDGDGSGGVKIIIKDTDINSTKQFNYNEYKQLQVQIKKLSQTLNKILNLKQYNIQNNTEIDGDGKTLPIMKPDFHQAIDFKKKFPFSLPWDVLYILKLFNSTPEAPAVTIDYPVISKGSGWGGYTVTTKPIVVDFNTDIWNKVAKVCRVMLFLLFAVGICWAFFVK